MITLRKAKDRGFTERAWLSSYHTFSFGEYHDPKYDAFSDLRVINDDIIAPNKGFPSHGHKDMEIVTIVLSGQLEHQDSTGNKFVIGYGDVQRMSAGKGIIHSEFNHSKTEPLHLIQIWIVPNKFNLSPSYEQRLFTAQEKMGKFCPIISNVKSPNTLFIHQDVELSLAILEADQTIDYNMSSHNKYWLHVATGSIELNGQTLKAGDGAGITDKQKITVTGASQNSEIILFKLRQ